MAYEDCGESVRCGVYKFVPLPGFRAAVADPKFDNANFQHLLLVTMESDHLYDDERKVSYHDDLLPSVALEAAKSRYVLEQSDVVVYLETALHIFQPSFRSTYTTLTKPLPAKVIVAAAQPDLDTELVKIKIDQTVSIRGRKLNPVEVLKILNSPDVREEKKKDALLNRIRNIIPKWLA